MKIKRPSLKSILVLWVPSIIISLSILLPLAYLLIRANDANEEAWSLLIKSSTIKTLGRTIWLSFWVTFLSIVVALPLAWLTTRSDIPLKRLWSILTPLPLVIPSYVGAYLLVSMLGPRGMVQQWLEGSFGVSRLPEIYGFPGALYILTVLSYPFILLSIRSALQRVDPSLEEASRSLGNNAWQTFWKVIFPQLKPAILSGSLLVALYVLRDFGAVSIMRYNTFTRVIYIQYQSSFDRSSAAILSLVLVSLTIIILLIKQKNQTKSIAQRSDSKNTRPPNIIPLGKWRWPAFAFCALLVIATLIIPGSNLVYWLIRGLRAGEVIGNIWSITQNSITASGLAALLIVLAAIPIAIISVRYPNKISGAIEKTTYLSFALPGIVVALALVFFGSNYAHTLYQTLPLLLFAYLVLFLPEAVGSIQTSLSQINPNLEEAARSLGSKPMDVIRKITLPLVKPGLLAGFGLVFLTTMKELSATLILSPIGFKTLSIGVWDAVSEAFFARAAAPALMIILISSIPLALITFRKSRKY